MRESRAGDQRFRDLRDRAERLVLERSAAADDHYPTDILDAIEELRVYQVELSIQNEELLTSQEALAALQAQYVDLYEKAPTAYFTLNPQGIVERVNRAGIALLGIENRRIGLVSLSTFVAPAYESIFQTLLRRAGSEKGPISAEIELASHSPEGSVWVIATVDAEFAGDDSVRQWRVTLNDISTQKRAQAIAVRTGDENVVLLRELNHRVMNSILMVASLIQISRGSTGALSEETTQVLGELESRVKSIAAAYELMHFKSGATDTVPMRDYVRRIVDAAIRLYPFPVEIEYLVADIALPVRLATYLGLAVNELAMNAVKYSFSSDRTLHLRVGLMDEEGEYRIVVSNDGSPVPDSVDLANSSTLGTGLQLISSLISSLAGQLSLVSRSDPEFAITVPKG